MKKVSEIVAEFLANHPDTANNIFMVSGGGNMHLIDSLGRNKHLEYICNHHEQACTFAAEGYARVTNKIGLAMVTTGPGGTNAITGVYSAWVDSIPTLTISGQVKFETTIASQPELNLRQLGDQEVNIIDLVKPITKYAIMVTDKNQILYHLEKAVYEAKHGRPGPVWIDIPLDIQGAMVDEEKLFGFTPPPPPSYDTQIDKVLEALKKAKRPVIIAGNGITLADANEEFLQLIEILKIPVVGTFARYDIVRDDHPLSFGRYGTVGQRAANFIVQNSDLLLAIGARMNIRAVSYNWGYFAREATMISVDIDENELQKHTLDIDIPIYCDAKEFIITLSEKLKKTEPFDYKPWIERCIRYRNDFPVLDTERIKFDTPADSYYFFDILSQAADHRSIFVMGNGTACVSSYQTLKLSGEQKVVVNSGSAAMGYDLPAAIGACIGGDFKQTLCITGEGSLQMNLQELQTIIHHQLPIKIFILNNGGYISIRNTQNNFFGGNKVGADPKSGVSFPDTIALAKVYGYQTFQIKNQRNLLQQIHEIIKDDKPVICEVILSPEEKMQPKLSSKVKPDGKIVSKPLEDMYPFLDREVFKQNMIVHIVDKD